MSEPTDPSTAGSPSRLPNRPQRLVVCALLAVAVAGLAAAVSLRRPEVHQSTAVLVIDQPLAIANAADGGLIDKLSRLRVKYADLVPTREIASPAAEELGIPVRSVTSAVTAKVPSLSLRVDIVATTSDGELAREMANTVAGSLVDYVDEELEAAGVEPELRYGFELVGPARASRQVEPTSDEALKLAVSVGLLTLAAAYVFIELLEAALRPRAD